MDVHVAERRQQQLALRLIAGHAGGQGGVGGVNGGDLAVFDLQCVQRGAGADHRFAVVFKAVFQPHLTQAVVAIGQGHRCRCALPVAR